MSDDLELVPPKASAEIERLEPPKAVDTVEPEQADGMVKLDEETLAKLDARVVDFVRALTEADVQSEDFQRRLAAIHTIGNKEIREAANVSNRILNKPIRGLNEDAPVSKALLELRRTVEELDPSGESAEERKLLGLIPVSKGVTNYFRKYETSQDQIDGILNALMHGQDELQKDIATIEQEKINLWEIMERLQQYIYATQQLDTALEVEVGRIQREDPEKARVIQEEILFYVRQKRQDLMTQLAVSIQGYLALDVIRKNDLELIKGVERASTTTISALRTAVIVAQALANQKLVLDQITALNTTTSGLIESTSVMLREQSGEIHRQAAGATVSMEALETAFDNVFQTLDMISEYKVEALDTMSETISALSAQVGRAKTELDRVREERVIEVTQDLFLPAPEEDEG